MNGNDRQSDPASPGDSAVLADAEADIGDGEARLDLDQAFDSGTLYALRAAVQAHAIQAGLPENRRVADEAAGLSGNMADRWPFLQGHGLWLVRLVADQISVFSGPGGTRATVVFFLSGKDPSVSAPD